MCDCRSLSFLYYAAASYRPPPSTRKTNCVTSCQSNTSSACFHHELSIFIDSIRDFTWYINSERLDCFPEAGKLIPHLARGPHLLDEDIETKTS